MDSLYRQLHVEGVGAEKHSIEPFRKETNISGEILLLHCYEQFSSTVEKKNLYLRGGEEHRNLKLSQLKRIQKGYIYTKIASKNCQGV